MNVAEVPPTPLTPFEPHSRVSLSPVLHFTVKMEKGFVVLTKTTDSLTPQVKVGEVKRRACIVPMHCFIIPCWRGYFRLLKGQWN